MLRIRFDSDKVLIITSDESNQVHISRPYSEVEVSVLDGKSVWRTLSGDIRTIIRAGRMALEMARLVSPKGQDDSGE